MTSERASITDIPAREEDMTPLARDLYRFFLNDESIDETHEQDLDVRGRAPIKKTQTISPYKIDEVFGIDDWVCEEAIVCYIDAYKEDRLDPDDKTEQARDASGIQRAQVITFSYAMTDATGQENVMMYSFPYNAHQKVSSGLTETYTRYNDYEPIRSVRPMSKSDISMIRKMLRALEYDLA